MSAAVTIRPADAEYPEGLRLLKKPPALHAVGNLDLLKRPAIGICGSRAASPEVLQRAYEFGQEAARGGLALISGYAKGVDRQAHAGAMEAGGATIAVMAEGIAGFRVTRELVPLIDLEANFLAVSMFEPEARWQSWRAMERNKVIVGLSLGLLVVEARERGGTIDAALECARQGKPLWAVAYTEERPGREGNRMLLRQEKALPLAKMGDVKRALEAAAAGIPQRAGQLTMSGASD
ncbi:MAG: DNA-processing protein DprA [Dehalococcoidia bacterium]|nr:DNA-processing protein DprA [Dehalococcoidia bacterium]